MCIARNRATGTVSEKAPSRRPHLCAKAYRLPKWVFPMPAYYTRIPSLYPPHSLATAQLPALES